MSIRRWQLVSLVGGQEALISVLSGSIWEHGGTFAEDVIEKGSAQVGVDDR